MPSRKRRKTARPVHSVSGVGQGASAARDHRRGDESGPVGGMVRGRAAGGDPCVAFRPAGALGVEGAWRIRPQYPSVK